MNNISLVILVGGKGSRIKHIEKKYPKPLIKFGKISFLDLLLNYYAKFNFNKIYLLAGYKGHLFKKKYDKKIKNFIPINVLCEKHRLGTGGALNLLKGKIKNDFILINGDSYFEINIDDLIKLNFKNKIFNVCLVKNTNYKSNLKLSNLKIDLNNNLITDKKSNLMNSGIYYFKKNIFDFFPRKKIFSLENELVPILQKKKVASGTIHKGFFIDIGTPKNYNYAKKNLGKILKKPAIFFDRDGVINYDYGYVHKLKNFKFKPNVIKALKTLSKKNYYIFIVTNQAGIGKNIFKLKDFFNLHIALKNIFSKEKVYIDDIRYCPYHPDAVLKIYKKNSKYRKPGNLMIESLFKNWFVDRKKSKMIGDSITDELASKKSNIQFYYTNDNLDKIVNKW